MPMPKLGFDVAKFMQDQQKRRSAVDDAFSEILDISREMYGLHPEQILDSGAVDELKDALDLFFDVVHDIQKEKAE